MRPAARGPGRGRRRPTKARPSSSAWTSTTERALPSSAVQLRCWSRPTTTTRLPFDKDCAACSACSRQTTTVKNDASCSLRPLTATRNMARAIPPPCRARHGRVVTSSSLRFHDLRHTCASLLIAQGASVKAVQAQLGHASATVTLDRHGHLFPDDLQQLADRAPGRLRRRHHGPSADRAPATCVGNAKRQVIDLPLLVEVGRLELPSRGVVPGLLRAQPPVEVQTQVVRWRRSRVLTS